MAVALRDSSAISAEQVSAAVAPEAQSANTNDEPTSGEAARYRVLVVDDEPALLEMMRRILERAGYEPCLASNGKRAIELARETHFDAILSDISMPGMDGIELLQAIRSRDTDVPVVLVTGDPAVDTAVQALQYGAYHYLTKPVSTPDLLDVLEKATCLRQMATVKREAAALLGRSSPPTDNRLALESCFNRALSSLWMAFQPILRADTGEVFGYEALLRSSEPSLPHPPAVLDAAERLGRSDLLGRTIRERCAAPIDRAPEHALLFVNLQASDLLDETLLAQESPLSAIASRVVLEITERASLDQVKDIRSKVAELRRMGYRIAIDDLGAGYAGLTSFALLEPEVVKLDMSLVRDVHLNPTQQKLIRSMTVLCKDMGMMVVGEGVETAKERDTLIDLGCDLLQGYLFSKPDKPFPEAAW